MRNWDHIFPDLIVPNDPECFINSFSLSFSICHTGGGGDDDEKAIALPWQQRRKKGIRGDAILRTQNG